MVYRDWNVSMWAHHVAAIGLMVYCWVAETSHGGCLYALLGEALVPWGFTLFYLRARGNNRSTLFRVVCVGGMATLVGRSLMWVWIGYLHNVHHRHLLPAGFYWFVNLCLLTGLALDR